MIKVLSIYTQYADKIFAGTKRIELRKSGLGINSGDIVMLYETKPHQQIRGGFSVERLLCYAPDLMWQKYHPVLGINKTDYDSYYDGVDLTYGFLIQNTFCLDNPISKDILEEKEFVVPQSVCNWGLDIFSEMKDFAQKYKLNLTEPLQLTLF